MVTPAVQREAVAHIKGGHRMASGGRARRSAVIGRRCATGHGGGRCGPAGTVVRALARERRRFGTDGGLGTRAAAVENQTRGEGDAARLAAVRAAAPDTKLIADANEAWAEAVSNTISKPAPRPLQARSR
jgi:L-alanine-DL-glutamate epimerase-like enolase superfamily enzyme